MLSLYVGTTLGNAGSPDHVVPQHRRGAAVRVVGLLVHAERDQRLTELEEQRRDLFDRNVIQAPRRGDGAIQVRRGLGRRVGFRRAPTRDARVSPGALPVLSAEEMHRQKRVRRFAFARRQTEDRFAGATMQLDARAEGETLVRGFLQQRVPELQTRADGDEQCRELGQDRVVEHMLAEKIDEQLFVEDLSEDRGVPNDAARRVRKRIDLPGRDSIERFGQRVETGRPGDAKQLFQEEWITGGAPHDLVPLLRPKRRPRRDGIDEVACRPVVDRLELDRDLGFCGPIARQDRPACDHDHEPELDGRRDHVFEDARARAVEPLRVVDDDQQRVRGGTEYLDDEIRDAFAPEVGRDRRALGRVRKVDVEYRAEQRCEWQFHRRDGLDRVGELLPRLHRVAGIDPEQLAQRGAPGHVRDRGRIGLALQPEFRRVAPQDELVHQSGLAGAAIAFDDGD